MTVKDGVELPTEEEQEQIVRTALGLIREPDSWTTGEWKCQARDLRGNLRQDANRQPLYQYCVHGALNQATFNVLGEERAVELGAVTLIQGELSFRGNDHSKVGAPAAWLGIDAIAEELYDLEAMGYNDSLEKDEPEYLENFLSHHENVLTMLRTKLARLTGKGGIA